MKFDAGIFGMALTLIFITLKLMHIISWSWFWVLSPLIFLLGFFIFLLFIILICKRIAND